MLRCLRVLRRILEPRKDDVGVRYENFLIRRFMDFTFGQILFGSSNQG